MSNFNNIFNNPTSSQQQTHPHPRINNFAAHQNQTPSNNQSSFFPLNKNNTQNSINSIKIFNNPSNNTSNSFFPTGNTVGTNASGQVANPFWKGSNQTITTPYSNGALQNIFGKQNQVNTTGSNIYNQNQTTTSNFYQNTQTGQTNNTFNQKPQISGNIFQQGNAQNGNFFNNSIGSQQNPNIINQQSNNAYGIFNQQSGQPTGVQGNQNYQFNQGLQMNQGVQGNNYGQNWMQPPNLSHNVQTGLVNTQQLVPPEIQHFLNDPIAYQIFLQNSHLSHNPIVRNTLNPVNEKLVNPIEALSYVKPIIYNLLSKIQFFKINKLYLSPENYLGQTQLKNSPYKNEFLMFLQELNTIEVGVKGLKENNTQFEKYRKRESKTITEKLASHKASLIEKIQLQCSLSQIKQELSILEDELHQQLRPIFNAMKVKKSVIYEEPNQFIIKTAQKILLRSEETDKKMNDLILMANHEEKQQEKKHQNEQTAMLKTLKQLSQYYEVTLGQFYTVSAKFNQLKMHALKKLGLKEESQQLNCLQEKVRRRESELEKEYKWNRKIEKMIEEQTRINEEAEKKDGEQMSNESKLKI